MKTQSVLYKRNNKIKSEVNAKNCDDFLVFNLQNGCFTVNNVVILQGLSVIRYSGG